MSKTEVIDRLDRIAGNVEEYFTTTQSGNEYAILTHQTAAGIPKSAGALERITRGMPVRMLPYPVSGRWTYVFHIHADDKEVANG